MTESESFMEELLADAEKQEEQQTEAYFDLLLLQISQLQDIIDNNFAEAEKEIAYINQWTLSKNLALQERISLIEKRLESFITERGVKTIDLPHGTLKMHKKPDKVEITDLAVFLKEAKPELLTIIPEQVKPDLMKIKTFLRTHVNLPNGVMLIRGKEEFSYKLNNRKENDNGR